QIPLIPDNLYGQWRNDYMWLEMRSYKNSDTDHVFEVERQNWEKKMNIRPIRTYLWANGTYHSMHIDLYDSIIYNPAATWRLERDSIFMTDTFPEPGLTYVYHVKLYSDSVVFTGIEDLDADGETDDLYFGILIRYR